MKYLVLSDTHGSTEIVLDLLNAYDGQIDGAIHLGDNSQDMTQYAKDFPGMAFHAAAGNSGDYGSQEQSLLTLGGRRVFITHGHRYNVKMNTDRLVYRAREVEADACLFGHTHKPVMFDAGPILFFNPGSPVYPFPGTEPGYGLLHISDYGVITGEHLKYD